MTEIMDSPGETMLPYLAHLGEKGIGPNISRVIPGMRYVYFKMAKGPRLGELFVKDLNTELLIKVFESLGYKVGYISKYGIIHGHLHDYNVVVEGEDPILIDWRMSSLAPMSYEDPKSNLSFWMTTNSQFLLKKTKESLDEIEMGKIYPELETTYSKRFKEEFESPLEVSHETIDRNAASRWGIF